MTLLIQNNVESDIKRNIDWRLFSPEWKYKWDLPDVVLPPLSPNQQSNKRKDDIGHHYKLAFGSRQEFSKSKMQLLSEKLLPKPRCSRLSNLMKSSTLRENVSTKVIPKV